MHPKKKIMVIIQNVSYIALIHFFSALFHTQISYKLILQILLEATYILDIVESTLWYLDIVESTLWYMSYPQ